jgi:hypothetical protein
MKSIEKTRSTKFWLILAALAALAYFYLHNPRNGGGLLPPCLFNSWTGYYCPGCGTSRAIYHLLHGEIWTAIRLNPLNIILLPLIVITAFSIYSWHRHRGRPVPVWLRHPIWLWLLIAIVIAFWVFRNLPGSYLAPF